MIAVAISSPSTRQARAADAAANTGEVCGESEASATTRSSRKSRSWQPSGSGRLSWAAMTKPAASGTETMPAAGRVAACPPSTALTALTKSVGSSSQGSAINSSGTPASVNSKAVARAKRPVPMITAGAAVGSACSRIASSRPRPCVRWPISRPSSWCSRRLQPPAKWAAGLTEATRLTAGCRSGPANRQPWKPMAEIPASASGSRSGTTSSVRKRQSSESRATTRSKRYCAGLPAAGWPKRAMTSCSAGLVMASFATPPGSRRRFFCDSGRLLV